MIRAGAQGQGQMGHGAVTGALEPGRRHRDVGKDRVSGQNAKSAVKGARALGSDHYGATRKGPGKDPEEESRTCYGERSLGRFGG